MASVPASIHAPGCDDRPLHYPSGPEYIALMDGKEQEHVGWLSMVEHLGRFVTVGALEAAEAHMTHPVYEISVASHALAGAGGRVADVRAFLCDVPGWSDEFIVSRAVVLAALRIPSERGGIHAPAYALRSADEPPRGRPAARERRPRRRP